MNDPVADERRARRRQPQERPPQERPPPDRQQAWDYLLNILSRQAYTVMELRNKLNRRRIEEPLADELIARLIELRLVDDEGYAEQYVTSRQAARGRLALRTELLRKGVAEDLVDERVGRLGDDQQLAAAVALLRKHAWRYRPTVDEHESTKPPADDENDDEYATLRRLRQAEAKAKSFLARRGFSPDVVIAAIDQVGWFAS